MFNLTYVVNGGMKHPGCGEWVQYVVENDLDDAGAFGSRSSEGCLLQAQPSENSAQKFGPRQLIGEK